MQYNYSIMFEELERPEDFMFILKVDKYYFGDGILYKAFIKNIKSGKLYDVCIRNVNTCKFYSTKNNISKIYYRFSHICSKSIKTFSDYKQLRKEKGQDFFKNIANDIGRGFETDMIDFSSFHFDGENQWFEFKLRDCAAFILPAEEVSNYISYNNKLNWKFPSLYLTYNGLRDFIYPMIKEYV